MTTSVSDTGLMTVASRFSIEETLQRLTAALAARSLSIFATIDHAKGARDAGLTLRPTTLVIFGNPKGGTAVMQDQQTSGLDLPMKALIWKDAGDCVWLTYNGAEWLAARHGLGAASRPSLDLMAAGLAAIATAATTG